MALYTNYGLFKSHRCLRSVCTGGSISHVTTVLSRLPLFEQAYVKISSEDSATYSYQGSELSLTERRQEEKKGVLPDGLSSFSLRRFLTVCLLLFLGVFDGEKM